MIQSTPKHSAFCREWGKRTDLFCDGCEYEQTPAYMWKQFKQFVVFAVIVTLLSAAIGWFLRHGSSDGAGYDPYSQAVQSHVTTA